MAYKLNVNVDPQTISLILNNVSYQHNLQDISLMVQSFYAP